MKKALLVLGFGLIGAASAQSITLTGGAAFTGGTSFHFGVTANNLTYLGDMSLSARASADLFSAGTAVNFDAFLNLPLGGANLYFGPGVAVGLGGSGAALNLTGGLNFPIASGLGAFAEGGFRMNGGSVFRAGLSYTF